MEPGVYGHISNAEYHRGPGVSKSMLDLMRRSPSHLKAVLDNQVSREPTAEQAFGSAFHTLLLEPDSFEHEYVVVPDEAPKYPTPMQWGAKKPSPDTIYACDWWREWEKENSSMVKLDRDDMPLLLGMHKSVMAHAAARSLLVNHAGGVAENSAYWLDPDTGALCRCRPDFWRFDGIMVDVKTAADASGEGFARSILNWRYHVQDSYYIDGAAQAVAGDDRFEQPHAFVFLAVEKKPPFAVGVYSLDAPSKELGRVEYRRDLALYAKCLAADHWPGYGDRIQSISLPEWHLIRNAHLIGEK